MNKYIIKKSKKKKNRVKKVILNIIKKLNLISKFIKKKNCVLAVYISLYLILIVYIYRN